MSLRLLPPLIGSDYRDYRRRAIFSCHKWDPQVEDVATIAPFALSIAASDWSRLSHTAEQLAAEVIACEDELWQRGELHAELGLSLRLRLALRNGQRSGRPVAAARVMRFDFHPTAEGWRLSEVNSDVPGGFNEAGGLTALMAEHHRGWRSAGDPAALLAQRIAFAAAGRPVALVHCSSYSDDRQVMEFLADRLRLHGARCIPCAPDAIRWHRRQAQVRHGGGIGAIIRFFPGEWLTQLGLRSGWWNFFAGDATPAANPGSAVLSQSKRLPLVMSQLASPCPAWRAALPETRDPRQVGEWDAGWLLKPAWGRVGEGVVGPGFGPAKEWESARRAARTSPRAWIAQRRFDSEAIDGPDGPLHACLGVYTIDGRASGIYGRVVAAPPVDHRAQEVAVLIAEDARAAEGRVA